MNAKKVVLLLVVAIMLLSTSVPNAAFGVELSVKKDDASCFGTASTCFNTIQAAIDYVNSVISLETGTTTTFSIQVEAGEYPGAVTLGSRITSLKGRETARTILTGNGSGTLVTASTSSISSISNLTFANAAIGIDASNYSTTFEIKNNIFRNITSAAVILQNSTNTTIANNVFYANGTAISTDADRLITNNIFLLNTMAIDSTASTNNITYNDFSSNTADGVVWNTDDNINSDPLFVDAALTYDFHLLSGSLCIAGGSGSIDMGAYGGSGTDTIPFQVTGVTAEQDAATSVISVNWTPNLDYKVTGYNVYYGKTSGGPYDDGTVATEGSSPISVQTGTGTAVSATVSGLTATVSTPASPVLYDPSPLNESLNLSWSAVTGVTKYKVYFSESSFDLSSLPSTSVEVGNTTSTILPDLINEVTYYVAVSAISEASYYIAVTAIYADTPLDPGISNESLYSEEVPVGAGESKESPISNVISDYPEALVGYPNLPDSSKDCFIATAAYGHYSASQVQALRKFRDQYLLTNRAGSAFVRWYYKYGPVAAAYLEAHPGYKPVVRVALTPAVGTALFMTRTPLFIKAVVTLFLLILALMTSYLFFRKRLSGSGGTH